ncbi:spore coat protein F [Paenibacillus antibioticophila]|uniref:Spore coat protein F n=1 Tax=Paenibacillus antibioticophila TaxID=1274374 RepID=A0A920CFB2_9BACL|nr:spore coat protein [Paenibacillus antibioticophila]GIO37435.1 spore coat protein F [Paenibacillus antibioticophila]
MNGYKQHPHLAWHETLELHELVAFQSNFLMGFKMNIGSVHDPELKNLYAEAIKSLEQNLTELLPYYQIAPVVGARKMDGNDATAFYALHLLIFAKTAVRNYAIAITETATPNLRNLLQKQLNSAIKLHGEVYHFMYKNGLYPSYNLNELLMNDQKNAKLALNL